MTSAPEPFIHVPDSVDAPSHARVFVGEHIGHVDDRARDIIELLVSELVTNAYRHGRPPVRVAISVRGAAVRVEVHDYAPAFTAPTITMADLGSSGGWGLAIVGSFATAWGITDEPWDVGKRVWFELDTTGPFPDLPGISQ